MRCPTCNREVNDSDRQTETCFPFCSDRCKLIDVGRWLTGKYQIPVDEPGREITHDERHDAEDRESH